MSLPITAVGPLKVLTKPIFTAFCAQAGAAANAATTARPIDNLRIFDSPLFVSLLVSRFRSSPEFAARSVANFGIEGHWQRYDSSAALNPKFAIGLAASVVRTSGSRHWCLSPRRPV